MAVVVEQSIKTPNKVSVFFKKYFTRSTLIIGLVVLSSVSIYTTCSINAKYKLAQSELGAQKTLYSIVVNEKARLDSMVTFYKHSIDLRDAVIIIKEKELAKRDTEIASLRKSLSNALSEASTVNASESYKYINIRIPATAPKIYPLDSVQVKTIHKTFLERDGYLNISIGLDSLVKNLKQLSFTKDNQIGELKSLSNVYLQEKYICEKEKESYSTEVKALKKEVRQQKGLKTVSSIGILGLAVVIIAIIL